MDFDSRETLWASFIKPETNQSVDCESICKTCAALEMLKLSLCAGNCNDCEKNLLTQIFPDVAEKTIRPHLENLKANFLIFSKLEELEKKVPIYNENYLEKIENLELKVCDLVQRLEKLLFENKNLKTKLLWAQACNSEYKEKYEDCLKEVEKVRESQKEVEKFMESIGKDVDENGEVLRELKKAADLEEKIEKLDDKVIDEYGKIDEIWGEIQEISAAQKKIENSHEEVKKYIVHCKNLDCATETILEYHHSAISFLKVIDSKMQEMLKTIRIDKFLEVTSEEFKNNVMQLRKQTESLLGPS